MFGNKSSPIPVKKPTLLYFFEFFPLMFSLSIQVFPSFCTVYFGPDCIWLNPEQGTSLVHKIISKRRGTMNQKEVRISFKAGLSFTLSETTGQTHSGTVSDGKIESLPAALSIQALHRQQAPKNRVLKRNMLRQTGPNGDVKYGCGVE